MGSCCSGASGGGGAREQSYTADDGEPTSRNALWSPELWYVTMHPDGKVDLSRRRLRASKLAPPSPAAMGSPSSARRSARQAADTLSRSSTNTSFSAGSSGTGRHNQRGGPGGSARQSSGRRRYCGSAVDGSETELFRNVLESGSQSHISDYDSDGRLTTEPWAMVLATRETAVVIRARLKFDITGAIDQFEVPPEHPQVLASSYRKSVSWLPDSVTMAKPPPALQPSAASGGGEAGPLVADDNPAALAGPMMRSTDPLTPCQEDLTTSPVGRSPRLRSGEHHAPRGGGSRARRAPLTVDSLEMHIRLLQWSEVDAKHKNSADNNFPRARNQDR